METVAEIIDALGGPTAFGRICGFSRNPAARGSDMRQRGSIPVIYWPHVVEAAEAASIAINSDILVRAHQRRRSSNTDTAPQMAGAV